MVYFDSQSRGGKLFNSYIVLLRTVKFSLTGWCKLGGSSEGKCTISKMFFPDLVYINRAKNIFQETYTISEPKFRWFIFLSMKTRQFWHLIEPVKGPGEARGLSARQIFFVSSSKGHFQRLHGIFENLLYENLFSLHFSKKLSKNKNFLQHSHSGLSLHFGKKMSKNLLQKIYCMANLSAYIFVKNCPKIFCNIFAWNPAYILVRRCPKIYCNRSAVSQIFPPYNLVKKCPKIFCNILTQDLTYILIKDVWKFTVIDLLYG